MPADRQWFFASFRLDPATMCLWRDNQLVPLASKPFAVLAYLVAHAGQVVTKEALLEAVWPGTVVSEGVLKTSMGKLRQALGETARTPLYIDTVHGRGYRFIAPVEERLQESDDDRSSRRSTPASSQSPDPGPYGADSRQEQQQDDEYDHARSCLSPYTARSRSCICTHRVPPLYRSQSESFPSALPPERA